MKIAIVHDYLIDFGGAERVLLALMETYPTVDLYVSILDKKGVGKFWQDFKKYKIHTSWFNYLPFAKKIISPLRFLLPTIWKSFDLTKYDLIISSASWAVTKGFEKKKGAIEICYLHTPPRYLYGYDTSRKWEGKWYGGLINIYSLVVNHFMRMYDFKSAQKVDYFIANSINTGKRIEKFYRRKEYQVIYPPIEVEKFINSKIQARKENYFLTGGRLVAAKNFDLIIKACKKEKVTLKIFGEGIYRDELEKLARGGNIEFLGKISDEGIIARYKSAKAFIVAQKDEDLGITPIEANACGCPVIAYKGGGYLETVVEGKTGIFFDELTTDSLVKAIKQFNNLTINYSDCINQAKKFSKERFVSEIKEFIQKHA